MTSKPKALGLALCAVFAMGAIGASAASASPLFVSNANPTFLTASGISGEQQFTTTVGELSCNSVNGSAVTGEEASEIELAPIYSGCEVNIEGAEFEFGYDFNSCYYLFTSTLEGEHAPLHIECEEGDEIEMDIVLFGEYFPCMRYPAQTPTAGGAVYTTQQAGGIRDIEIDLTMAGVTYTEVEASVCNEGATVVAHDGVLAGTITLRGYSDQAHTNLASIRWE